MFSHLVCQATPVSLGSGLAEEREGREGGRGGREGGEGGREGGREGREAEANYESSLASCYARRLSGIHLLVM